MKDPKRMNGVFMRSPDVERIAADQRWPIIGSQATVEQKRDTMRHGENTPAGIIETATEAGHHHPIPVLALRHHPYHQVIEENIDCQHPDHPN
jgi:hypothetical protein